MLRGEDLLSRGFLRLVRHESFDQGLIDFQDSDFIAEAGPAAEHVWIFLGSAAGVFRFPVAQEYVMMFAVAVEEITAVALGRDNLRELAERDQRGGFHFGDWLPDCHRQNLLRHTARL